MARLASVWRRWWPLLLVLPTTGCFYSLDVEGKQCTPGSNEHTCPAGYSCAPSPDGGYGVCLSGAVDSGSDSGTCIEGEKACQPDDPLVVLECQGGAWQESSCPEGQYCFFTGSSGDEVDCVSECGSSTDCGRDGYFCDTTSHHCSEQGDCEPAGAKRCVFAAYEAVETCDPESRQWVEQRCESGQYCHERYTSCLPQCSSDADCADLPDEQNPEPNSCDLATRKCQFVELCALDADCGSGRRCVGYNGGACVPEPGEEATTTQGSADLDCYKPSYSVPADNGTATECILEGYVTKLMGSGSRHTEETIGLTVEAFAASDVLAGNSSTWLAKKVAVGIVENDKEVGFYHFDTPVPTKQSLVFRVTDNNSNFKTTYLFGYYLRADACDAGSVAVDVPAMKAGLYTSYTEGSGVVVDPRRGLLMVRTLDCSDVDRLIGATISSTIDAEAGFYIKVDQDLWVPDTSLAATTETGWWGAANAEAIAGVVGAMAKQQGSLVGLGGHLVRVFSDAVSVFVYKTPQEP